MTEVEKNSTKQDEVVENVENVENVEKTEVVENTENVEKTEKVVEVEDKVEDNAENAEAENVEALEDKKEDKNNAEVKIEESVFKNGADIRPEVDAEAKAKGKAAYEKRQKKRKKELAAKEERAREKAQAKEKSKNEIHIYYKMTEEEYIKADMKIFYSKWTTRLVLFLNLFLVLDLILCLIAKVEVAMSAIVTIILAMALLVIVFPMMLKRQDRKLLATDPIFSKDMRFAMNPSGFKLGVGKYQVASKWEDIKHIRETKDGFVIRVTKYQFFVVPYRVIDEEQRRFLRSAVRKNTTTKQYSLK